MRGEVGEAEHRRARLAGAEKLALAAELQIVLGDAEPVVGGAHRLEPLPRDLATQHRPRGVGLGQQAHRLIEPIAAEEFEPSSAASPNFDQRRHGGERDKLWGARRELSRALDVFRGDPRTALGVPPLATPDDVRRAFRELAKRWHPARFARLDPSVVRLANEVFLAMRDAQEVLIAELEGRALAPVVREGAAARVLSAIPMPTVCEAYIRDKALDHLEKGRVVIFAGGTGNPYFTTDTAAALRAAEMGCDALLKATQVDGVYSADPEKVPDAKRYDRLTYDDVLRQDLRIMDGAAIALARDNRIPIIVFSIKSQGGLASVLLGQGSSTLIEARGA